MRVAPAIWPKVAAIYGAIYAIIVLLAIILF